jgi:aminopeptidase N
MRLPKMNSQPVTVHRADYRPPAFLVDRVVLDFDLDLQHTAVAATLQLRRNPAGADGPLRLDGVALELVSLAVDGEAAGAGRFELDDRGLLLREPPASFELRIETVVRPQANTALLGLFDSNGSLFTQCEAEGFRRITYFPDRPDVMAVYEVTLRADRSRFPVLLSNGNLVAEGPLPEGRHFARWSHPFAKPSYLFALVAGRFECEQATLRTRSGREALLQVWVEPGQQPRARHALDSLKKAIAWDQERYGRELDLDRFMIVASNDFNLGAMENKGLNIFNARRVLADPQIATDTDFATIEAVVAHEYFHNWTGNRVTCRDWFQLSLKEGLTVFRDQQFSADMAGDAAARAVCRIADVQRLRELQFPEDAGPMAHPVRPDSYVEIGNFYTPTVYEKGAEVVRVLHTLLGEAGFRRGMDLYFERHDGRAATCDDFIAAMADANGRDLAQFSRWYAQAGTPRLTVSGRYSVADLRYELTVIQHTPPTPGQPDKQPLLVALALGLVSSSGRDMPLQLLGEAQAAPEATRVLELAATSHTFTFINVPTRPVPSLNRGFSAPVQVDFDYAPQDLTLLAEHDSDLFNRWDAGQRLATGSLLAAADAIELGQPLPAEAALPELYAKLLADASLAPAFRSRAVTLPSELQLAEARAIVEPEALHAARRGLQAALGTALADRWRRLYADLRSDAPYSPDRAAAGRRALRNTALAYLAAVGSEEALALARAQLDAADNLTDREAALAAIVNSAAADKAELLVRLARDWAQEPLLMNKWFELQATASTAPGEVPVLARVRVLLKHRGFSLTNPNNVQSLVLAFCARNPAEFHRRDGAGYAFWTEQVLQLDRINPTMAARLARVLERWRRFTPDRQRLMREALETVARAEALSRDVREIVDKALREG